MLKKKKWQMKILAFESSLKEEKPGLTAIKMCVESESKKVSDLVLSFVVDISNRQANHVYPVSAIFDIIQLDKSTQIMIEVPSFSFDPSLTLDELTNIGAFELSGKCDKKTPFSLAFPVFCSADDSGVHFEIFSPIETHQNHWN